MRKLNRTGEKHTTNEGYEIEIVEYFHNRNCTIRFKDGFTKNNVSYTNILRGCIRNPYHASVCGVGVVGEAKTVCNSPMPYQIWVSMLKRCYDKKFHKRQPTYKDVEVCGEWLNFQNFAAWYEENYNPEIMEGWQLDKDAICKQCKIYSPETCAFVPEEINRIFVEQINKTDNIFPGVKRTPSGKFQVFCSIKGKNTAFGTYSDPQEAYEKYKSVKQIELLRIAEKWKGKIDRRVYTAIVNYEITNQNRKYE